MTDDDLKAAKAFENVPPQLAEAKHGTSSRLSFMPNKINVTTDKLGAIRVCSYSMDINEQWRHLSTQVIQTQDAAVRHALIQLGWTPPSEK